MKAATITNEARNAAEASPENVNAAAAPAHRATITGGRAGAPLTGRVRGTGVPGARVNAAESAPAVLCNITPQTWILHRTHGTFVVAGRAPHAAVSAAHHDGAGESALSSSESAAASAEDSAPYALTQISARTGAIDLGDKRTLEFPISARDIAEDLAREINADGGEASYFGVFVCEGDAPTGEELAEAHERLATFYRTLITSADKQWERTHNVVFISDLERRAAREMRLEKDWSYEPQQKMDCPACGEKLKPGVAVCRVCGAVLNREKAAQFGLVAPVEAAQGAAGQQKKDSGARK